MRSFLKDFTQVFSDLGRRVDPSAIYWIFLLACAIMLLNGCLPIQERKCIRGSVIIPTQYGMMKAGDVEICGQDLETSSLYGPSFEAFIDHLKEDIKELKESK